jgi:hypothetical protein
MTRRVSPGALLLLILVAGCKSSSALTSDAAPNATTLDAAPDASTPDATPDMSVPDATPDMSTPDMSPPDASPDVSARCDLAGRVFEQRSAPGYCDRSLWRFTARPDGKWNAMETGCANATGVASYDGTTLVLDFVYDGGRSSGRYSWPLDGQCRGSAGTVQWLTGPIAGQSTTSTLSIVSLCDLGAHVFEQRSAPGYCDRSVWRFTARPDGRWSAAETGCANATGIATYDGTTVVLDFVYDGGLSSGRYSWPLDGQCRGTPGTVQWLTGPIAGQSTTSTLSISAL